MSSAARFLLEFQVTGDQEVVAKIREVGTAGQETATKLESLQGIEDPFAAVGEGADKAVAPIEGVGTAAEGAVTPIEGLGTAAESAGAPITDMGTALDESVTAFDSAGTAAEGAAAPITDVGTAADNSISIFSGAGTAAGDFSANMDAVGGAADTATGGIDPAAEAAGRFGSAAETSGEQTGNFGSAVAGVSGSIVAVGGAIGTAVGAFFRYQDAQLRVEKTQVALARGQEAYRKTMESIQTLLGTATGNFDAIALASGRFVTAQGTLNGLLDAGVTSGAEYEAAVAELNAAQAELATEAGKGGVEVSKLTGLMNKAEIQSAKNATTSKTLDKNFRQLNQTFIDGALSLTTIGGSLASVAQTLGKTGALLKALPLAALATGLGVGAAAVVAFGAAVLALSKAPYDTIIGKIDQIGVAAGRTFPGIQDALTSTGDAFRSSLDFLAGYTESFVQALTGIKLQEDLAGMSTAELTKKFIEQGTTGRKTIDAGIKPFVDNLRAMGKTDSEIIEIVKKSDEAEKKRGATMKEGATITSKAALTLDQAATAMIQHAMATDKSREMTDGLSAAFNTLIGPTTQLNGELANHAAAVKSITAADVESVAATEARNRAMIIATSGVNNAAVAEIQFQQALTDLTQTMVEDTDEKNANARATLALADSNINAQNAIATVNEEYANSVDRLADLNTVMGNADAKYKAVTTLINEQKAALMEESLELDASIQSASDLGIRQQQLANAYKQGIVSIDEWSRGLKTSAQEEQGAIDRLADFGFTFSDLPGYMAPTLENLQLFTEATRQGGEAAQEMADMASQAFQTMTSEAQGLVDSMADAFLEGGKDFEDNMKSALDKIPPDVRDSMSKSQLEVLKGVAEMEAAAKAAVIELGIDLKTEDFAAARADFTANLRGLASESDGIWKSVWNRAAELASTGSEAMVARISEIVTSGDSPQIMLQQLDAAFQQFGPKADSAGTQLVNGLTAGMGTGAAGLNAKTNEMMLGVQGAAKTGAAEAGKGAGIALSQEFAAAGTHIAAVIKGIQAQLNTIGAGAKPIPIQIDNSVALSQIQVLTTKLGQIQAKPIPITVDNSAAISQIQVIVTKLGQIQAKPIALSVDNSAAISQIAVVTTKLGQIQAKPVSLSVDNSAAISQINAVATKLSQLKPVASTITYTYKVIGKPPVALGINAFVIYRYKIIGTPPKPPEIKRFISYAYRITNKIPNPPEIKRFITYRYRTAGSPPNPKNITRTITYRYRTVGSRPAQFGMHETLAEDTMIAAHKGERVDIGRAGTSNTNVSRTALVPSSRGGGAGGARVLNIDIPIKMDGREVGHTVRRYVLEGISGA